ARACVEHRHVLVELLDEFARRGVAAAGLLLRPGPGREVVPARTARGLRIRRYHRYSLADQVAPVLDVLRVALANQENNGRCVRRGMLRQTRLPVDGQQLA